MGGGGGGRAEVWLGWLVRDIGVSDVYMSKQALLYSMAFFFYHIVGSCACFSLCRKRFAHR